MTIQEALVAELDEVSVSTNTLLKVLSDNELEPTDDYEPENEDQVKALDYAIIAALRTVLARPNISEGGYSITWNEASIRLRLSGYYSRLGLSDPDLPIVQDVSYLW